MLTFNNECLESIAGLRQDLQFTLALRDMVGARLLLSGTMLRKLMSEGNPVPSEFSRPEVIAVLREYYDTLEEKVEVKLHKFATGETKK